MPPREYFYNQLRKEYCTQEEYDDAKQLFIETGCRSLADFMALYNVTDVIFLAVICRSRFGMLKEEIGLHPANFTSMSSMSVSAMTRKSRCFVQHIPIDGILAIVQAVTRGGYSGVHHRLSFDSRWLPSEADKAAHKLGFFLREEGLTKRIIAFIEMYDENNQYGGAMTQPLPYGNYRVRTDLKSYKKMVDHYATRKETSYCACVDMYLPDELHDNRDLMMLSMLVAAEKTKPEELSSLQLLHLRRRNAKNTGFLKLNLTEKRAISSFRPKKHIWEVECLLSQHVKNGWIVTKVYSVLEYDTETFMKDYVEGNQKARQMCTSTVLSDLYKYANNACFGGVTLRYDNRLEYTAIYDQIAVAQAYADDCRKENRHNPYRDDTDEKIKKICKQFARNVTTAKEQYADDPSAIEALTESMNDKFQDKYMKLEKNRPAIPKSHSKNSQNTSPQTVATQLYHHLSDVRTQTCTNVETTANGAMTHIVSKKKKKQTIKSVRITGSVVLAYAKVSIGEFHKRFVDAIMNNYKTEEDYAEWVKDIEDIFIALSLTDTDSVCYQVIVKLKDTYDQLAEQEVHDFVHYLVTKHVKNIDTSNFPKDHPQYDISNKKRLHYYKLEVPTPNYIGKLLAVNPKEYFVVKSDNSTVKKHKGVHRNTVIKQNEFMDRLATSSQILNKTHSIETNKTLQNLITTKDSTTCMKTTSKKVLSILNDKRYIFHDGIVTVPHGHKVLKHIIAFNKSVSEAELCSDAHIEALIKLEIEAINSNMYLKGLSRIIAFNRASLTQQVN